MAKSVKQFCVSQGIKQLVSTVNDHRGTGMVERMIQTIKHKLFPSLDEGKSLKEALVNILEIIRCTENRITKYSPFHRHWGRKPNTYCRLLATKPSKENLSWPIVNEHLSLDHETLDKSVLDLKKLEWRYFSEDELDIVYKLPD